MKKFKKQKVKKIQQVEQIRDKKSQEVNEKFFHNHGRENRWTGKLILQPHQLRQLG